MSLCHMFTCPCWVLPVAGQLSWLPLRASLHVTNILVSSGTSPSEIWNNKLEIINGWECLELNDAWIDGVGSLHQHALFIQLDHIETWISKRLSSDINPRYLPHDAGNPDNGGTRMINPDRAKKLVREGTSAMDWAQFGPGWPPIFNL